jgi:hypothetical protein
MLYVLIPTIIVAVVVVSAFLSPAAGVIVLILGALAAFFAMRARKEPGEPLTVERSPGVEPTGVPRGSHSGAATANQRQGQEQ